MLFMLMQQYELLQWWLQIIFLKPKEVRSSTYSYYYPQHIQQVVTAGSLNFPEAIKLGYDMLQELMVAEDDVLGARQREAC